MPISDGGPLANVQIQALGGTGRITFDTTGMGSVGVIVQGTAVMTCRYIGTSGDPGTSVTPMRPWTMNRNPLSLLSTSTSGAIPRRDPGVNKLQEYYTSTLRRPGTPTGGRSLDCRVADADVHCIDAPACTCAGRNTSASRPSLLTA